MSTPETVQEAVKPKPVKKPPSVFLPRAFAALAIITLVAIPVVVPVVYMKMTGKSGRKVMDIEQAIEAPPPIVATAPEETTKEEIKESFLKLNNDKVGCVYSFRFDAVAQLGCCKQQGAAAAPWRIDCTHLIWGRGDVLQYYGDCQTRCDCYYAAIQFPSQQTDSSATDC